MKSLVKGLAVGLAVLFLNGFFTFEKKEEKPVQQKTQTQQKIKQKSGQAVKKEKKVEPFKAQWQKVYGGKSDDIALGVVALDGGHSVVVGTCNSFDAKGSGDMCVTRINQNGDTIWRAMLGGDKAEKGKAIARSADGNLLVLGETKSFSKNYDRDLYVVKLNLDGKVLWEQSFGGERDETAGGIAGSDDGGAVVVGDSDSYGRGYRDVYLAKLDKDGKVVAARITGGEKDERIKGLTRVRDGNMVLVGYRETDDTGVASQFFAMKLDQNLKAIWSKTFGEDSDDKLHGVAPSVDGGVVATGETRSYDSEQTDLSVMKLDVNGEVIWHKLYGFKYYEYGQTVATRNDGGFIVAGATNTLGKGDHSYYVLALSKHGDLEWSKVYGDKQKDIAHSATRLSNGSIVIVGESDSFTRAKNFFMVNVAKR